MRDTAASPAIGALLCAAITLLVFAAMVLPVLSWCWSAACESTAPPPLRNGGEWATCDLTDSGAMVACYHADGSTARVLGTAPNCWTKMATTYRGGGALQNVPATLCEVEGGAGALT